MSTKNDVLEILEKERGRFISGSELAEILAVSRTAVWKAVKGLEEDGHRILAVTNRGYMLDPESDLLSEAGVRVSLPEKYQGCPIEVLGVTDSTNIQAKKLAADGAVHGTIVLAEEQTAGHGRFGRNFYSPRGGGLYMSVILKPGPSTAEPQMITVAAAVSVCHAIEKLDGRKPRIKWVNDVYLNGRKICGILTEAVTDFESGGIESIVVGIGVDCNIKEHSLPDGLRGIVGSLGGGISRNRLASEIAAGLLDTFDKLGGTEIVDEYRARSLMYGKKISFIRGEERVCAQAVGISDKGGLLVRLENGEETELFSGEVTLGSMAEKLRGGECDEKE